MTPLARRVCVAALAVAAATSPASAQSPPPTRAVTIADNFYLPSVVEVAPGTTLVWRYASGSVGFHSVTTQPGAPEAFDSSPACSQGSPNACMTAGGQYAKTVQKPGTYAYYCKIHGARDTAPDPAAEPHAQPCRMCGIVRVKDDAPPPTLSPGPATPTPRIVPEGQIRTPGPRVIVSGSSRSPSPEPTPEPEGLIAAPSGGPVAIPISTPAAANAGGGAGVAVAVVSLVVVTALGAGGVLTWRRRSTPSV